MGNRFDECSNFVHSYLEKHRGEPLKLEISEDVKYLMSMQYMEGYCAGIDRGLYCAGIAKDSTSTTDKANE
jgi:hypothetical protein